MSKADDDGKGPADTLRQRLSLGRPADSAVPTLAYEEQGEDRTAAHLRALLAYGRLMAWLQRLISFGVGVGATLFAVLHTAPPQLALKKIVFSFLFLPLYWLVFVIAIATKNHYEVNDMIMRCQLVLVGAGAAYVFLSLFNAIMLALELS